MTESDGAAIALITRAVELDRGERYTEALVCYKEGLQLLLEFMKVGQINHLFISLLMHTFLDNQ